MDHSRQTYRPFDDLRDGGSARPQRSTGELVKELIAETQTLVREEVRLAKAEFKEDAQAAVKSAVKVSAGGLLAHTAALTLVAAVVLLLSNWIAPWLSALIVAAVLGIAGALFAKRGVDQAKQIRPGEQVAETMKENQQWLKQTTRDLKSTAHVSA